MFIEPTLIILLALFAASFVVQSEWLFFVSVCLVAGFLYLKREERKLEAAEEKAEKEKVEEKPERRIIVLREPVHEPLHEKLPLEIADEVLEKTVFHGIRKNTYTYGQIEKDYGPEHHGH